MSLFCEGLWVLHFTLEWAKLFLVTLLCNAPRLIPARVEISCKRIQFLGLIRLMAVVGGRCVGSGSVLRRILEQLFDYEIFFKWL
jgi:hypothetical protein